MRIHTHLSAAEAESGVIQGGAAVVIDVIRATSTMVEALAAGARSIYPTVSTEEAIRLANSLGREDTLLCGERRGLPIPGFDLGNSPREYSTAAVGGRRLVMTTTNGTRAFAAAADADRVVAGSFLNLGSVIESLVGEEEVAIICAGKEGRFALDDAVCAGLIVRGLLRGERPDVPAGGHVALDDASRAVLSLAARFPADESFLRSTAAGTALVEVGLDPDLADCAAIDRHDIVPEMRDRMICLPAGSPREEEPARRGVVQHGEIPTAE